MSQYDNPNVEVQGRASYLVTEGLENQSDVRQNTDGSRRYERYILDRVVDFLGRPAIRFELWDGFGVNGQEGVTLVGTVRIKTRDAFNKLLSDVHVGLGDEYSAGRIVVDGDLVDVLTETFAHLDQQSGRFGWIQKVFRRKRKMNTIAGSKQNIFHHYDLNNDFYALWLDREMQYTCAYFADDHFSLEDAQLAKMDHICRKLQLKPGDRVAEAGSGWGGLARHMALYYSVHVTSFNISQEQVSFSRERAAREGYSDRVDYVEDDYRTLTGEYDAFVSVGMLEHVGQEGFNELGRVINRCLTPNGRGLIHSIGRNRPANMNAWIEKRIFPGAYPPALSEMMDIFQPNSLSIADVENLRLHYARTLEHWLHRFEKSVDTVESMFDPVFVRLWRLYLSGSIAAFLSGNLQLFQVLFNRERDNSVAWTRDHIYPKN